MNPASVRGGGSDSLPGMHQHLSWERNNTMTNRILAIQLDWTFGVRMAAAVHRNGKTKLYLNLTRSSWNRVMETYDTAMYSTEHELGQRYTFHYN